MRGNRTAILQCLAAAALFGLSTPASKLLLGSVPPVSLAGLLYLGAAVATFPAAARQRGNLRRVDRRNLLWLAGAVVFGGVLGPVLLLWGLSRAPAASVALWLNLETVATGLLAWAWFKEHLGAHTLAAMALVIGASVLLAAPFDPQIGLAALLVTLACVCWGLDNNFTALIDRLSPTQTTFAKGLVAGGINLGLGLLLAGDPIPPPAPFAGALALGGLSYGASLVLYISGAQQVGATRSQLIFATAPFWGVVLSWLWLDAAILGVQLAALGVMLVAVWLLNTERHAHVHTHGRLTHTHAHRHDDVHHDHDHPDVPAGARHTHEHTHEPVTHTHPHAPDLHHRHEH